MVFLARPHVNAPEHIRLIAATPRNRCKHPAVIGETESADGRTGHLEKRIDFFSAAHIPAVHRSDVASIAGGHDGSEGLAVACEPKRVKVSLSRPARLRRQPG